MDDRFPQKQETSEKLKAKQYGAAALTCVLVAAIMTVIRLIWGSVMLGSGADGWMRKWYGTSTPPGASET